MIALLGHPPLELVARVPLMEYQWPEPVKTADGVTYDSAEEYFGGPFFDQKRYLELILCLTLDYGLCMLLTHSK